MISPEKAQSLPLNLLKMRIDLEEETLESLKEIYRLRCELETHLEAEKVSGCKGKWVEGGWKKFDSSKQSD